MNQKIGIWGKRIRATVISVIIGGVIVWFLLSKIDPRDIPRAIGRIPFWSMVVAFLLYSTSVFLKACRFRIILKAGVSLRHLFPIVSLYMLFANILPMRVGELSYIYLLKKQARTPGAKSFASLITGGIADTACILLAMVIVGWRLRDALAKGLTGFLYALRQRVEVFVQSAVSNFMLIIIIAVLLIGIIVAISVFNMRNQKSKIKNLKSKLSHKVVEVGHELANISFDIRLLAIIVCSILIMAFRFGTQWYLVKSMGIGINIWELSFALLFGVLFSLVPIHGLAGLGTVEAPWVIALLILNIPQQDAITSGFGLHIIIIMYCIILGLYGAVDLRILKTQGILDFSSKSQI